MKICQKCGKQRYITEKSNICGNCELEEIRTENQKLFEQLGSWELVLVYRENEENQQGRLL